MRTRVLLALDRPLTPGELRKTLKTSYSQLSDVLRLLRIHQLVECLNDEAVVGRLYQRTEAGDSVASELRLRQRVKSAAESEEPEGIEGRLRDPNSSR